MTRGSKILVGMAAFVLFIGLCVGGWYGYWALQSSSQQNRYQVNTHGQQYQSGIIAQARDDAKGWNVAVDSAQKKFLATEFCTVYLNIDSPKPADIVADYAIICN